MIFANIQLARATSHKTRGLTHARPPRCQGPMTSSERVSVIIPVYNEARTVASLVRRVRAVPLQLEIITVNDASTDGSGDLLEGLREAGVVDVVLHPP